MPEKTSLPVTLGEMTVRDVMVRDVVTTTPEMRVADLIRLFEFEQISGAPVIEHNRVVGVVSATDVMRLASRDAEIDAGDTGLDREWAAEDVDDDEFVRMRVRLGYFLDPDEIPSLFTATEGNAVFSKTTVRQIMTPATFSVHATTGLTDLARFLARGRIHRALVLDGDRLEGIVTAFDIVRAVAGNEPVTTPA